MIEYYAIERSGTSLYHHGILGMKWGVRRYQNKDGSLTSAGKQRYNTDHNRYELNATRRGRELKAASSAHVKSYDSGDKNLINKTEKKARKALNKYLNAESKAASYYNFESHNSKKKYLKTESKIRRLSNRNADGRYDQKLRELSDKSNAYKNDAESKQWMAVGRRLSAEKIANMAASSGYTVNKIAKTETFQTGKQRMAILLGIYSATKVSSIHYDVRKPKENSINR